MRANRGDSWEVVVIGAGPAGSTCAAALAAEAHEVLLLEKDIAPGASANCTGIIGTEAFEAFDVPVRLAVGSIDRLRFRGPDDAQLVFDTGRPLAHVARRYQFDRFLADRAVEAGAVLRTGATVRRVEPRLEGFALHLTRAGGELEVVGARSIVIAVGYCVSLLRQLGLAPQARIVQGAQWLCPARPGHPSAQTLTGEAAVFLGSEYAPGGFGWTAPAGPGWVKIGTAVPSGATTALRRLARHPSIADAVDLAAARCRTSPIPVGTVPITSGRGFLVVGEAAGQVKSTSHGGIYYSMLGGQIAGAVLHDALASNDLSAEVLGRYDLAWRQLLEREIAAGLRLRSLFEGTSDEAIRRWMMLGRVPGAMALIRRHADFDWHAGLIDRLLSLGGAGRRRTVAAAHRSSVGPRTTRRRLAQEPAIARHPN